MELRGGVGAAPLLEHPERREPERRHDADSGRLPGIARLARYFTCGDLEDSARRVAENGGRVIVPATAIPAGRFLVATDLREPPSRSSRARWTPSRDAAMHAGHRRSRGLRRGSGRGLRARADPHALLAEDPLGALRGLPERDYAQARRAGGASQPGYITSFVEQVLVDSKRPDAKPLPIGKMMIHHLLYFAPHRVDQFPGSCLGLIGLRGEEEPLGHYAKPIPAAVRSRYGINNRTATGQAPNWILVAMVMNHYARAKDFYVRTKVRYTTDPREPVSPIILGDCTNRLSGNLYDVPGGGGPGSSFVERGSWRVPDGFNGRIILAQSHQHGGARYQTLGSRTCGGGFSRRAPTTAGRPPLQHRQADPARTGADRERYVRQREGHSDQRGRGAHEAGRARRQQPARGRHGVWWLLVAKDDRAKRCGPVPRDLRQINRPPRFAKHPDYDLRVPQLAKPQGPVTPFDGNPITLGDDFFRPDRISARVGETISWRFGGALPLRVRGERPARLLLALLRADERRLQLPAAGARDLPSDLPRAPHPHGPDPRRPLSFGPSVRPPTDGGTTDRMGEMQVLWTQIARRRGGSLDGSEDTALKSESQPKGAPRPRPARNRRGRARP